MLLQRSFLDLKIRILLLIPILHQLGLQDGFSCKIYQFHTNQSRCIRICLAVKQPNYFYGCVCWPNLHVFQIRVCLTDCLTTIRENEVPLPLTVRYGYSNKSFIKWELFLCWIQYVLLLSTLEHKILSQFMFQVGYGLCLYREWCKALLKHSFDLDGHRCLNEHHFQGTSTQGSNSIFYLLGETFRVFV